MTFARGVLILAIVTFLAGTLGAKFLLDSLFSTPRFPVEVAVPVTTATPTPFSYPVATSTARPSRGMAIASPTRVPVVSPTASLTAVSVTTPTPVATLPSDTTPTPALNRASVHKRAGTASPTIAHIVTPIPTAFTAPTIAPTEIPTAGPLVVALANYWVGSTSVQPGGTIAIGYVINNESGRTAQVALGVSMKPSRVLSWFGNALADPTHDAVAVAPPGTSTHTRFFTFPATAAPGSYDVSWGLKDPATGVHLTIVSVPAVLQVIR